MTQHLINAVLEAKNDPNQRQTIVQLAPSVEALSDPEVDQLVRQLADLWDEEPEKDSLSGANRPTSLNRTAQAIEPIVHHLAVREAGGTRKGGQAEVSSSSSPSSITSAPSSAWSDDRLEAVKTLYHRTPATSDLRNHLLRWLAIPDAAEPLNLWTDLISDDPPEYRLGIVHAFAPLLRPDFVPPASWLQRLLDEATPHAQIAPAIFDLCNYYFRTGRVSSHPAATRGDSLTQLLGQLAGQLGRIEEEGLPEKLDAVALNQIVSDAVALIVSLCDTLALLQYQKAIPKLHQVLGLRHRRVQVEAATALARLGDSQGKQALIELANEPAARLRVLAYAKELGFDNEISLELKGEIATAESHLATWLSEPEQMGIAPTEIKLIHHQEMAWPSYEHPVQCYLFRYAYGDGESAYRNVGICGPLTHAFPADIQHLSTDDMLAAFAGWQAVHPDIYQMAPARAQQLHRREVQRLQSELDHSDLAEPTVQTIGSFFGRLVLVATGQRDGEEGTLLIDEEETTWIGAGNPQAPIDWQLAYAIWKGRQLLNEFNSEKTS